MTEQEYRDRFIGRAKMVFNEELDYMVDAFWAYHEEARKASEATPEDDAEICLADFRSGMYE